MFGFELPIRAQIALIIYGIIISYKEAPLLMFVLTTGILTIIGAVVAVVYFLVMHLRFVWV